MGSTSPREAAQASSAAFPSFNWLRGISDDLRISILHRIILMRICLHRYNDTGKCDPGYDAVATELGVHRTTVIRAVEIGVRLGWLAPPIRGRREKANFVFTFPLTKQEVAPKGDFNDANEDNVTIGGPSLSAADVKHHRSHACAVHANAGGRS
jgi:hypothetical protein